MPARCTSPPDVVPRPASFSISSSTTISSTTISTTGHRSSPSIAFAAATTAANSLLGEIVVENYFDEYNRQEIRHSRPIQLKQFDSLTTDESNYSSRSINNNNDSTRSSLNHNNNNNENNNTFHSGTKNINNQNSSSNNSNSNNNFNVTYDRLRNYETVNEITSKSDLNEFNDDSYM